MEQRYRDLIEKVSRISPLNPVMLDLLAALQNDSSQVSHLKIIIESDANTSATILKIANSPFYGMSGKIKTIRDACVLLGYDQLKNVIYATALDHATNKGPHQNWCQTLRMHTQATAIIAREMEKHLMQNMGEGYASGLLHELGMQIILAEFPDIFSQFFHATEPETRCTYLKLFDETGEVLAKRWRLPSSLQACIRHYREPENAPAEYRPMVELVSNAHCLAEEQGYPSPGDGCVKRFETQIKVDEQLLPIIQQRLKEILQPITVSTSC